MTNVFPFGWNKNAIKSVRRPISHGKRMHVLSYERLTNNKARRLLFTLESLVHGQEIGEVPCQDRKLLCTTLILRAKRLKG